METDIDEAFRISLKTAEDFAADAVEKLMHDAGDIKRTVAFTLNDNRQFLTPSATDFPPLTVEPAPIPGRKNIIHKGWALRTVVRLQGPGERTDRRHFLVSDSCDILLMWDRRYATHVSLHSAETARMLIDDTTMARLAREIMDIARKGSHD